MTGAPASVLSLDEQILALLLEDGPTTSATIAHRLQLHERTARRRLRRLIRDGYIFSPERGSYRITAAGAGVMAPVEGSR